MKRPLIIASSGAALLLASYFVLQVAVKRGLMPNLPGPHGYVGYQVARPNGFAPVQLWGEPQTFRTKGAARIVVARGDVHLEDKLIARQDITANLNEMVRDGRIHYVVISSETDTKWGEILPVLDECRKSQVRVVFLNYYPK